MLAVRKTKKSPGLELCEIPEPKAEGTDVVVKVVSASICGSDTYVYKWEGWAPNKISIPLTLGHEVAGIVAERGPLANSVNIGDKVALESHIFCGNCANCKNDKRHICERLQIIGLDRDGGFATYIKIPAACCWQLPDEIDVKYASLMEPLGNAVHAIEGLNLAGKSTAVLGCGPIGLFTIQLLKNSGASDIWAVEPSEFRRRRAESAGATRVLDPAKEDLIAASLKEIGSFDYVFEMSGNFRALKDGLRVVKNGGTVVAFGLQHGEVPIDITNDIILREVTVKGIVGRHMFKTWEKMTGILKSGGFRLRDIVSYELPLAEFDKGFKLMTSDAKETLKVVFRVE